MIRDKKCHILACLTRIERSQSCEQEAKSPYFSLLRALWAVSKGYCDTWSENNGIAKKGGGVLTMPRFFVDLDLGDLSAHVGIIELSGDS